uniref:Tryptophan synthase beta chain-like PALP domain-containing protein n=1 Tax=Rhodosorus marinus TaxID=101924 RepID=A0A7S3AAT2_9RHOD|mmetsp:Transcript_9581/g.41316  ORF Transcript_9581/g.41316 Transcript_9581/m.41316 type:complete len:386 (+) Transcript_9581:255-1412(+)
MRSIGSDFCGFLSPFSWQVLGRRDLVCARMNIDPRLLEYEVPEFASRLKDKAPPTKLSLAMVPTPIQRFRLPEEIDGFEIFVKRDDMTGSTLSGNKIRKLEFILADALEKKADTIVTCGGIQSNFCRITALAAKELNLQTHVLLRSPTPSDKRSVGNQGNVFLHKLNGTTMHLVKKQAYLTGLLPKMEILGEQLSSQGLSPYLIAIGGSDTVGLWGYIECWKELLNQNVPGFITDVVVTIGSGGTAAGLAIGNYLSGSKVKMHAISVCDNAQIFHEHVNEMIEFLGLSNETKSEDILNIIDGYKGRGYALSTNEELDFITAASSTSGVPTDPVYTGKGETLGRRSYLEATLPCSCFVGNERIHLTTSVDSHCLFSFESYQKKPKP